ncbi:MAG: hypothetical protein MJ094_01800 [Saccharofermentans sp.]|nr:hypothetical protein [Saccharofermentans sp.]
MASKKSIINRKSIIFAVAVAIISVFLVMLIPLNSFKHGFYFTAAEKIEVPSEDWHEPIQLDEPYTFQFEVTKKEFNGIALFFADNGSNDIVNLTISNGNTIIDSFDFNAQDIKPEDWYIFETSGKYEIASVYTVTIDGSNCDTAPSLQGIDNNYISNNLIDCNVLAALGIYHDTFSPYEKTLITLFLIAFLLFLAGELFIKNKALRITRTLSVLLAITTVLTWTFMFNSIDSENSAFVGFQNDSDDLVMDGFSAMEAGVELSQYGLGTYHQYWSYRSDLDWNEGFNRFSPAIIINKNEGTEALAQLGNVVRFEKGQQYRIIDVVDKDGAYVLTLDSPENFSLYKHGNLRNVTFLAEDGTPLLPGVYEGYTSSLGLQGKVFRHLANGWEKEKIELNLWMVCSLTLGIVLSVIVILINRKYNFLMALCFGLTFLLSPWIVNYSNSVYWVEFTWFLPMVVGLICSIWINNKVIRIVSYLLAFGSVMIKSLCGYEFITAVMLGLISFILVDLFKALFQGDKKSALLIFRTTVIIGIAALLGFFTAIALHANLRGDGSIIEGIKSIIERDVLRRVGGCGLNDFEAMYWPSINASIYETFSLYFHFKTDIIAGIDSNQFITLIILPIVIFIYDYFKKKLDIENTFLYAITFLTSISWFVLAKNHSYIHTHMNFVMWYFGFVQVCLYVILDKIVNLFTNRKAEN